MRLVFSLREVGALRDVNKPTYIGTLESSSIQDAVVESSDKLAERLMVLTMMQTCSTSTRPASAADERR